MSGETLLLVGELLMGTALVALIGDMILFRASKRKLNAELEQKYGKKRR